ncbi:hypothetical protein GCM10010174_60090 [Kutzneria viridogrisea]
MVIGGRRPGRPPTLCREDVARATLAVGIEQLSLSSVARHLGVSHSTLYRYVRDKDDLLAVAVEQAFRTADWPNLELGWRELLQAFAEAIWVAIDRHPGLAEAVHTLAVIPPTVVRLMGEYGERLRALGFHARDAMVALDFIADLAMSGMDRVDQESTWRDRRRFDDKLEILLDGLAARINRDVHPH